MISHYLEKSVMWYSGYFQALSHDIPCFPHKWAGEPGLEKAPNLKWAATKAVKVGNNCMQGFALNSKFLLLAKNLSASRKELALLHWCHHTSHSTWYIQSQTRVFFWGSRKKIGYCHKEPYRDHLGHPKNKENFARSWKENPRFCLDLLRAVWCVMAPMQ